MLLKNGEQLLKDFTEKNHRKTIAEVAKGVWFVVGLGHSNAIFIEADSSIILIDTLDTLERGEALLSVIRQKTGKEVKTVIYTHGHPDHRGGAGAFLESKPEIIAFDPKTSVLEKTELLKDIQNLRGARQFGFSLTDEEAVSQGIGPREGVPHGEHRFFVPPSIRYGLDKVVREIDGIQLEMVRLPGEADDQMMIWLPQKNILCCGDNYYGCFPNLYAIRGGQYRDLAAWIHSLDVLRSYPAQILLPGHMAAVFGHEEIEAVLGNYRNAFEYLLVHTLEGMNQGKDADQLAFEIQLPSDYADLPYLAEHYGCVEWTIRAIYAAYMGWFDGNPVNLHPLPPKKRSQKMVSLMGGVQAVLQAANAAMEEKEYQWCLELCELLLTQQETCKEAALLEAAALEKLAAYETSANGRHYYLEYAKEIRLKLHNG